jgi:hypothetical protein
MTLSPSTAASGVAAWISSLPVSPVSRSAQPGSSWELTMNDGSGLTLHGSSVTWNPDTSSWRTSQTLFATDFPKSSMTLPRSGSMRNGDVLQREPLAPLRNANGSGYWPTPRAHDAKDMATCSPQRNTDGLPGAAITAHGNDGSAKADLNPFFVATLMGLPMDWLTHSTSEVTALCRNALRKPSDNSQEGTEALEPNTRAPGVIPRRVDLRLQQNEPDKRANARRALSQTNLSRRKAT